MTMGYQEQDDFDTFKQVGQRELGWPEATEDLDGMEDMYEAAYDEPTSINPWLNLPLTSETQLWKHGAQFTSPFRLKSLPNELLLMIASFLPPESSTALALTDHHWKDLLGFAVKRLNPPPEETRRVDIASCGWKFLRLLEKDSLDKVACPGCMRLHTPFWRSDTGRVCVKYWTSWPQTGPTECCHYLNIRHAVIQHAREPFKDGQPIPAASKTRMLFHDEMKGVHTVSTCFVNGRLLSRVQTVLAPQGVLHEPLSYQAWQALSDIFGPRSRYGDFGDWPCKHVGYEAQDGREPSTRAMARELIEAGMKHVPGFEQLEIDYPDKIKDLLDRYDRFAKSEKDPQSYAAAADRLRTACGLPKR
ncbi:hypothetical protein QBC43DRAFT_357586 [Cladorrhinum sp. PSN259]|nr:hypothetical protein QBC43DRAFT_357586 [Cladorrhinum sp. PSN259]